jgi:hypothetical protein
MPLHFTDTDIAATLTGFSASTVHTQTTGFNWNSPFNDRLWLKKTVARKQRAPPLIEELRFKLALFMADIAKRFIPGFSAATKGRLIPGSGKVTIRAHYGHGTLGEQTGIGMHGHLQRTVLLKWLRSYTGKDTVTFKLLVLMTPVTERFVMGPPATAECNLGALLE